MYVETDFKANYPMKYCDLKEILLTTVAIWTMDDASKKINKMPHIQAHKI